jgi:cytoskeletal protein RodZ
VRRTVLLVGAWLVGGAAAVGAASLGVSRVGDEVTGNRPTPLSAAEVREELAAAPATTTTSPSPVTTATTTPTTTTTTIVVAPQQQPTTTTEAVETRTYALVGGTATLRFAPSGVTVVAAAPNPGFSVETSPEHGNGIRVEFDSDDHRSRVTGWWENGPRDEVREED